jgi:hypothetical protein
MGPLGGLEGLDEVSSEGRAVSGTHQSHVSWWGRKPIVAKASSSARVSDDPRHSPTILRSTKPHGKKRTKSDKNQALRRKKIRRLGDEKMAKCVPLPCASSYIRTL